MEDFSRVRAWEEDITLPTYPVGEPDKNPMFFEKRVYQGSSGVVYPHPIIEKISDEKIEQTYHALFLENRYLKIMILPELGGRVHEAYDKIAQRHFIYYNQVVKPALVGLTGPWISGGIEFNWPQHHRPSTFEPVDFTLETHDDGSATVWVSEVERMFRTKGMAGFTLFPDKAYLKITGKLYNRTTMPQHFLWWANPAVSVNDDYQSVFPPDVHAVFDHGKRDVSRFPIATGTYYKMDYSAGVDISRYKNIPVPTSYMAIQSKYDFVGGYDHGAQAGVLHVADHHISPGKKQWTWGCGDFGQAWDRNLTDEDGPYIELMTGVYTDNQPDFTWLQPGEEKMFHQYFLPYHSIGVVKNATTDALVNLEISKERVATVSVYVTAAHHNLAITLHSASQVYFEKTIDLSPEQTFVRSCELSADERAESLRVSVTTEAGVTLVAYQPETPETKPLPESAKPALPPEELPSTEQLYLTGLHLEQYRHATYDPTAYYKEALKRDPGDIRNNNALGLWLLRHGQFQDSETYFRRAIKTLTQRNPNPYDGEPYYNLGLCLKMQGKLDEAFDAFFKSVWNGAWQDSGYFALAQIATSRKKFEAALELIERSLSRNTQHHKGRHLNVAILRHLGQYDQAEAFAQASLELDHFNFGVWNERALLLREQGKTAEAAQEVAALTHAMRNDPHTQIEYALDYAAAGLFDEAIDLLSRAIADERADTTYPMVYYYLGYFEWQRGHDAAAAERYQTAAAMKPDYCFPNHLEAVAALTGVNTFNPTDAKAFYYLGNFWYDRRQYDDAIRCWETARALEPDFPTTHRNLALAYYNKRMNYEDARLALEKAFALNPQDARVLMELDQLYKKLNRPAQERLAFLERHLPLVELRDDLYLERAALYNQLEQYETARTLIAARKFHPWEGGEGKVSGQYVAAHLGLAKQALKALKFKKALEWLDRAKTYPHNLGEGKLYGASESDLYYFQGVAFLELGDRIRADGSFAQACRGAERPSAAMFYNDQPPEQIFYQGLAFEKLSQHERARSRFHALIDYAEQQLFAEPKIDYFAVSLPDLLIFDDDLNRRNRILCHYLLGLGYLGLCKPDVARREFDVVTALDVNHQGAAQHLAMIGETYWR